MHEQLADEERKQGEDDEQPQGLYVSHATPLEVVQCDAAGNPEIAQRAEDAPVQVPEGFEHFLDGVAHMLERVVRRLPAAMAVVAMQDGVAVLAGGVRAVGRAHGQWARRRLKAPTIANFQDSFSFVWGAERAEGDRKHPRMAWIY